MTDSFDIVPEEPSQEPLLPKPVFRKPQNNLQRSLVSLVIFFFAFMLIFDMSVFEVMILTSIILIHELGHLFAMKSYGYKDLQMFFIPLLGAMASGDKEKISQWQRAVVILAGPIPGIVLGCALFFLYPYYQNEGLLFAAQVLLMLNVFNLLPVPPLDGGKFIETLFFSGSYIIQIIFLIISLGLTLVAFSFSTTDYILLFFAFIIIMNINQKLIVHRMRKNIGKQGLSFKKSYEELTDQEYWSARKVVIKSAKIFKSIDPEHFQYHQREYQIVNMLKLALLNNMELDMTLGKKLIFFFLYFAFLIGPVLLFLFHFYPNILK